MIGVYRSVGVPIWVNRLEVSLHSLERAIPSCLIKEMNGDVAEERQAVGWSDQLYQSAIQNYATTSKLMDMFGQITATGTSGGLAALLGK